MKRTIYILFLLLVPSLFAQNNDVIKTTVSLNVSAVKPIGVFAKNWDTGGGIYLGYGWEYNRKWGVKFQTGYNRYRLKSGSALTESPKLSMWAFQIGGRRYFLAGDIKPFVTVLSGINIIRLIYKIEETKVDERETHMNFQMGGGVTIALSNSIDLEISILYNSHLINPSIPYNLTGFESGMGVSWKL